MPKESMQSLWTWLSFAMESSRLETASRTSLNRPIYYISSAKTAVYNYAHFIFSKMQTNTIAVNPLRSDMLKISLPYEIDISFSISSACKG